MPTHWVSFGFSNNLGLVLVSLGPKYRSPVKRIVCKIRFLPVVQFTDIMTIYPYLVFLSSNSGIVGMESRSVAVYGADRSLLGKAVVRDNP